TALVTLAATNSTLQHTDSAAPYLGRRFYRAEQVTNTVLTGDHFPTTNGEVVVHVLNHASFLMTWQGKTIYSDAVSAAGPFGNFPKADLMLVTHIHGDHFSASTLSSIRAANGIIIAPQAVYNDASMSALRGITGVMTNGASTNLLGLNIQAVPAYNPSYHPLGTGNGYVLTLGGKRFFISGDTGDIPEIRALPNIDVAFLCMNLPYTMSITNAALSVRVFRPKVVYPYHYRNSDNSLSDLVDFKRRVGQDLGIEVRLRKWY
ncbi:MAG: metal-dependent hydrolase, partial [Verrucomicrobiales bacterium]|nr:metal-dependent hydrolase [Verrucomicrobiales bacterium]